MKRWCLALLLLLPVWAQAEDALRDIRLVSEVWHDYTNTDGSGLGWGIMRKVFEPAGVVLKMQNVPYTRSVGLVQRGEADAWLGSYRDEVTEGVFYPKWYYDQDPIVALGLRETPSPTLKDLGKYRLVWMRGYGYERYLPNVKAYSELQRRAGVLGMLKLGYADFYIDAVAEVNDLLEAVDDRDKYRVSSLTKLPLYVGFADTPKGRSLAELFDRRMSALVTAGRLRPVFSAWGQPYPF